MLFDETQLAANACYSCGGVLDGGYLVGSDRRRRCLPCAAAVEERRAAYRGDDDGGKCFDCRSPLLPGERFVVPDYGPLCADCCEKRYPATLRQAWVNAQRAVERFAAVLRLRQRQLIRQRAGRHD